MITPADDLLHPRTDHYAWSESATFFFYVPERQMMGWWYLFHRPNMKLSASTLNIWDPFSGYQNDMAFYELAEYNPLPEGAEMYDVELASGMWSKCLKPLESYHYGYRTAGCELELWSDAVGPVYELENPAAGDHADVSREMSNMINDFDLAANSGHYQGGAHTRGTLKLEDETIEIDCIAFRDHSWGPRLPAGRWIRGNYNSCYARDTFFSLWTISDLNAETDPFFGTTERSISGQYWKNGELGYLVKGTHRAERGEDGRWTSCVIEGTDHLGRELRAEGTPENFYYWHGYTDMHDTISMTRWVFDDRVEIGHHEDFLTLRQNRRLQRIIQASGVTSPRSS